MFYAHVPFLLTLTSVLSCFLPSLCTHVLVTCCPIFPCVISWCVFALSLQCLSLCPAALLFAACFYVNFLPLPLLRARLLRALVLVPSVCPAVYTACINACSPASLSVRAPSLSIGDRVFTCIDHLLPASASVPGYLYMLVAGGSINVCLSDACKPYGTPRPF